MIYLVDYVQLRSFSLVNALTKISIVAALFLLICATPVKSISFDDVTQSTVFSSNTIDDIVPLSNITVYKRWNEDEIPWDAWLRRGYMLVLIFVTSSFGIVVLLFLNNMRLNKMVKKNFQDLWEAEENYYRLLEIVNDAVIIIDPEGSKIIGANKQAEHLTGYPRLDLLDMDIFSITMASEEKTLRGQLSEIVRETFISNIDHSILTKDKKVINTTLKGRLVKSYNKTIILLAFLECNKP